MNDHDIEQLVSRLDRPSPTPALDARIAEITRQARPQRSRSPVRVALGFGGAIACAGLFGFVIGRQSVSLPPVPPPVAQIGAQGPLPTKPEVAESEVAGPEVIRRAFVPANEAFVQLMTKPQSFESVFGNRPLTTQASPAVLP